MLHWVLAFETSMGGLRTIPVIMTERIRYSPMRQLLGDRHHLLNDDNWVGSGQAGFAKPKLVAALKKFTRAAEACPQFRNSHLFRRRRYAF